MPPLLRLAAAIALLFFFLVGVNGLGDGFKNLGKGLIDSFFAATENPFVGLMIGILTTTLVQSSSVTTSLIVGLVAAPENPLPIASAVPMIMGANIGTTVTNTLVSLGHMGRRAEFQRAFAVATVHDFFNFIAVAALLPLELSTGLLRRAATWLASSMTGLGGIHYESPLKGALKTALVPVKGAINSVPASSQFKAVLLIAFSGVLIITALFLLVRVMRASMQSRVEVYMTGALEKSAFIGLVVGIVATVMVQSSSITTSLLVPLAGASVITLQQAFPITIGTNIGTTVTALLAALAATGPHAMAGVTIALVHLLFNVFGGLLIYPVSRVRQLPLEAARLLAATASRSRLLALIYVALLFYVIPALCAVLFG
ncbi:MAG: Na/Pi symporter [Acidobacteriota bacterium]|nr:MAG: Na/Pi symporter [Acidobacteriota bacterium]